MNHGLQEPAYRNVFAKAASQVLLGLSGPDFAGGAVRVIKAFLFGLGLGIGLGILFAPGSGQETRERISEGRERVDRGNEALRREGGPRPTGTEAPAV